MARDGLFGGFYFDPDVFASYMQEVDPFEAKFINSNVLTPSKVIYDLVGEKNNVFTVPFHKPLTGDAQNYDGATNVILNELAGGKQTGMAYRRMVAWTDLDFTRELSGTDPLGDAARKVGLYWRQNNQNELLGIIKAVMDNAGMANHTTDVTVKTGSTAVEAKNRISGEVVLDCMQSALGDRKNRISLIVMHSVVYTELQKQQLIMNVNSKPNPLVGSQEFGTLFGIEVVVDDYTTVETNATTGLKEYHTLFLGRDTFLTSPVKILHTVEYDRDAIAKGGVNMLITRTGRVIHPNGFSFAVDNVAKESPTSAELSNAANWTLKFNEKIVDLARLVTNA